MIDYHCTSCGQALRAPDGSSGKKAKCARCGQITVIPNPVEPPSSAEADPFADLQPPTGFSAQPPQPPSPPPPKPPAPGFELADHGPPGYVPGGSASGGYPGSDPYMAEPVGAESEWAQQKHPIVASPIDIGAAFSIAWRAWQSQVTPLALATFLMAIVLGSMNVGGEIVVGMIRGIGKEAEPAAAAVSLLRGVAQTLVSIYLNCGLYSMLLDAVRGRTVELNGLFQGGRHFLNMLVAAILLWLVTMGGMMLCVIPGLIVALTIAPWVNFLVVDERANGGDCIQRAWEIGKINIGPAIILFILSVLFVLMGIALCLVGVFLTGPLIGLLWAAAYLMAIGEVSPQWQPT